MHKFHFPSACEKWKIYIGSSFVLNTLKNPIPLRHFLPQRWSKEKGYLCSCRYFAFGDFWAAVLYMMIWKTKKWLQYPSLLFVTSSSTKAKVLSNCLYSGIHMKKMLLISMLKTILSLFVNKDQVFNPEIDSRKQVSLSPRCCLNPFPLEEYRVWLSFKIVIPQVLSDMPWKLRYVVLWFLIHNHYRKCLTSCRALRSAKI